MCHSLCFSPIWGKVMNLLLQKPFSFTANANANKAKASATTLLATRTSVTLAPSRIVGKVGVRKGSAPLLRWLFVSRTFRTYPYAPPLHSFPAQ